MRAGARNLSPRANAALGLFDQAISSFTNLGFAIAAAVAMSEKQFGAVAVATLVYAIAVPGVQSIVSQELVLADGTRDERLARARESLVFAMIVATATGCVVLIAAWFMPAMRTVLLPIGLLMPLLQVQDTCRFAASLLQDMRIAVFTDTIWLALGCLTVPVLRHMNSDSPAAYVTAWAGAGAVAGLATIPCFRVRGAGALHLRRFLDAQFLGYRFLGEFLALRASSQILTLLLGAIAGLAATAGLRGATVVFGPLTVLVLAASSFGIPLVKAVSRERREAALMYMAGALASTCAGLLLLCMLMPPRFGSLLLGQTWDDAMQFAPAVAAQLTFTSMSTAIFIALRIVAPRSTLRLRIGPAIIMPVAFLGGIMMAGPVGAAWGIASASGLQTVIAGYAYRSLRGSGHGLSEARF